MCALHRVAKEKKKENSLAVSSRKRITSSRFIVPQNQPQNKKVLKAKYGKKKGKYKSLLILGLQHISCPFEWEILH